MNKIFKDHLVEEDLTEKIYNLIWVKVVSDWGYGESDDIDDDDFDSMKEESYLHFELLFKEKYTGE